LKLTNPILEKNKFIYKLKYYMPIFSQKFLNNEKIPITNNTTDYIGHRRIFDGYMRGDTLSISELLSIKKTQVDAIIEVY
jgi:hypothetical protein